jgi:large subunit ribosomal protein L20
MARVKGATHAIKRRRNVLKLAKGFRFGRGNKERQAKEAVRHAGVHAYTHRKQKKSGFKSLWTTHLSAALIEFDISYSKFIDMLKKKDVELDRKVLSQIVRENPENFSQIVEQVK